VTARYNFGMSSVIPNRIESTPGIRSGKSHVAGTRITVADIATWFDRQGLCPEEIVTRHPQLTLADVHAALSFYFDNRDEIRREMDEGRQFAEDLKQRTTSKLAEKLKDRNGGGDPVSPG
jgi:uncharacterized protein (DUF433 family)